MIYILSILFILLNLSDYYLTKRILDKGGRELNPILRYFGVGVTKLILVPVVIVISIFTHWALLAGGCIGILFAVIWNWIQINR